jgi:dolichol-phosphate mannosyltransferase
MKTVLVIPTYNEADNIQRLISALRKLKLPTLDILVVDDNSPDGTSKIVQSLMKQDKKLHLLLRTTDRGRGSAGIEGFKKALAVGADIICEMDADFSHDPKFLPLLLHGLESADMVLGSRAVVGGKDDDRPLFRCLLTKAANFYIRVILGLKVRDCNSGYRCFKRKVLATINLDAITTKGPGIVQEILYRANLSGFRIVEIPVSFVERKQGTSKLGFRHLVSGYFLIIKLRLLRLFGKIS